MLIKLIKYEIQATSKNFFILFVIMAGITLLIKPLFWIRRGLVETEGVSMMMSDMLAVWAFFMVMSILATAAEVLIVIRYYQSMTCDEAYLTFTLPVTASQLIWAKVLVGSIWYLITFLLFLVCTVLEFAGTPFLQAVWPSLWENALVEVSKGTLLSSALMLIPMIVSQMLRLICVVGIGQLFGKYRLLATLGSYFVLNVLVAVILFAIEISTGSWMLFITEADNGNIELMTQTASSLVSQDLIISMSYTLILGFLCFMAARYIFSKKINLE